MDNIIELKKANEILKIYSEMLMQYEYLGVLGIFLVGSLADGNYIPGKSDLDVSVVVYDTCDLDKIKNISDKIIDLLIKKYNINIEFEAFIKKKEMLYPPYLPEQQKTIEIMRIKKQAKLLSGTFEQDTVPIPDKEFFISDEEFNERELLKKYGKNIFEKMTDKQIYNYIMNYMRLYNIVNRDTYEFNKKKILETYYEGQTKFVQSEKEILLNILNNKDVIIDREALVQMAEKIQNQKKDLISKKTKEAEIEM